MGLDSLQAMTLVAEISCHIPVNLSVLDMLREPTVEHIASCIQRLQAETAADAEGTESAGPAAKESGSAVYPLSTQQREWYRLWRDDPDNIKNNISMVFSFSPLVDLQRLKVALERVIALHPQMNGSVEDAALPRWVRHDDAPPAIEVCLLSEEEFVKKQAGFARGFDLFHGPLYRMAICKTPAAVSLLIDMFHIICDGVSVTILLRDLARFYRGEAVKKEDWTGFDESAYCVEAGTNAEARRFHAFYEKQFAPFVTPAGSPGTRITAPLHKALAAMQGGRCRFFHTASTTPSCTSFAAHTR
jgi:hypothetical protein